MRRYEPEEPSVPDMDDRVIELLTRIAEALEALAPHDAVELSDEELARRVSRGQRAMARRD